jgi:MFS family permease
VPIAASSTDALARSVADVGHLVRFRATSSGRTGRRTWAVLAALTLAAAVVPMLLPGARVGDRAFDVLLLMPTAMAGVLVLATVAAVTSGGGRELLPRDQAVAFPVSPTTDHLGALVLAPLNVAWLLQAWLLVGGTSYALGWQFAASAQPGMLLWLVVATATAQAAAWTVEGVRRRRRGVAILRSAGVALAAAVAVLQLTGGFGAVVDRLPTVWVTAGLVGGFSWRWALTIAVELALALVAIALGAVAAHWADRRMPHDELRTETGSFAARATPGSDLRMLMRLDWASVWRTVPMRRGLMTLAVAPGVVALAAQLPWTSLPVMAALSVAGGALLFGVNAWCLDGRGGLWRASLPVGPGVVFASRTLVLAGLLLGASGVTVAMGALNAGVPTSAEVAAVVATWLVVVLQVVAASMRWSGRHPYAVDLRSARATPAPPVAMVGYSARLALSTTVTASFFSALAHLSDPRAPLVLAVPLLCWSGHRLLLAHRLWCDPVERARVVTTVAA